MSMEFISTQGMTPDTAPRDQVLVQYLKPFFGTYTLEYGVGYYDNPNDYEGNIGEGWLLWEGDRAVCVVAYAVLPPTLTSGYEGMSQFAFQAKFGSFRPNHGSVGIDPTP